jgi:cytochrome c5
MIRLRRLSLIHVKANRLSGFIMSWVDESGGIAMNFCDRYFPLALSLGVALFFASGAAAQTPKSGEQVYKETCAVCHAVGAAGAPKFGDRKAWGPLIQEGQSVLTAHAWVGVRGMPPKGGNASLSLDEFSRAVAFMARAAGGSWKDPNAAMLTSIKAEERKRIESQKKTK